MFMPELKDLRILIALRDVARMASYQEFFFREGFVVSTASNGIECLVSLRNTAPDVLVIERDLHWGGGDGVLARIDEEAKLSKMLIIYFSPGPRRLHLSRAETWLNLECFDRYLMAQELVNKIRGLLTQRCNLRRATTRF